MSTNAPNQTRVAAISNVLTTKVDITVLVMSATDSWMTTRAVKVPLKTMLKINNCGIVVMSELRN